MFRADRDGKGIHHDDGEATRGRRGCEASCFAHLLDQEPLHIGDDLRATLVRNMADAVLIADPEGNIAFLNDAATCLFGWSASEAAGASLDLIIPERLRDRHWEGWNKVMQTGVTRYGDQLLEVPAAHRDGQRLSIAFTVSLLTGDTGEVAGVAAVVRDDTERWQQRRATRNELTALCAELQAQRAPVGAVPSGGGPITPVDPRS
jgi:PAS domain S-box-containing protein